MADWVKGFDGTTAECVEIFAEMSSLLSADNEADGCSVEFWSELPT